MKYFSTNNPALRASFKEAIFQGLPTDNGLYMPESIPHINEEILNSFIDKTLAEIGLEVLFPFIEDEMDSEALNEILLDVFSFDIPLIELNHPIYSLELFHGPTCAFKDVGARFLARCLSYFNQKSDKEITILVATSGDTGSAVAQGFHNVPNTKVVVLFPEGKVSELQQKQMTSLGDNITVYGVQGTFDDCQNLVKEAFLDHDLRNRVNITSANSINVARLLPQMIYFFYAWTQVSELNRNGIVFSVPSGNYGNLTAGLIAQQMGLPVSRFIAASNANNVVPKYLNEGSYKTKNSIQTYSNAMDVGNPSNFARMLSILPSHEHMIKNISGHYFTDSDTLNAISNAYKDYDYITDPHGAIGYAALMEYILDDREVGVFLHTAHPAKFLDIVENGIQKSIEIPNQLLKVLGNDGNYEQMEAKYTALKGNLLS